MLEYSKLILHKVNFDQYLFEKELSKSYNYLEESEKKDFIKWCSETFKLTKEYILQKVR
jgi:hypothetical protein